MGYQESVLKVKKKYQDNLINQVIKCDPEDFILCDPLFIIEVKRDIEKHNLLSGDKLIYLSGERDGQRSLEDFIDSISSPLQIDKNIENKIYPIEELEDLSLYDFDIEGGFTENDYFKIYDLDTYKNVMSCDKDMEL